MTTTPNGSGHPGSRYLTPCRTFGLKRKSTPKSSPPLGTKTTRSPDGRDVRPKLTGLPEDVSRLSPLTSKRSENRRDTWGLRGPPDGRRRTAEDGPRPRSPDGRRTVSGELRDDVTPEMLRDLVLAVNRKSGRLDGLMTNQAYTKKHDFEQLQKSTEKWKSTCKDALNMLLSEMQQRGHDCNMLDIMAEHNIPPKLLNFDTETFEFL